MGAGWQGCREAQHRLQPAGGYSALIGEQVPVSVDGDLCAGVAELRGDVLDVRTQGDLGRREEVAEGVHAQVPDASLFQGGQPDLASHTCVQRPFLRGRSPSARADEDQRSGRWQGWTESLAPKILEHGK
jgi:hypothetical protein